MKIEVLEMCDGFAIVVDGKRFNFDQEDTIEEMTDVLKLVNPKAEVTHVESY